MNSVTKNFLAWYQKTKRPLPWRDTHDPYKIWVSEIFLQQTQASRVIDYYERCIQKFPTVEALAAASWEEFLPYFQGLGFYSRGRNMLKAAQYVMEHWDGKFSRNFLELQKLPGVGQYTAAALCSFAYGQNIAAFDTNLYRVMGRFFGIAEKNLETKKTIPKNLEEIEKKSEYFYCSKKGSALNHAFMDLGSSLCTAKKVQCSVCPLQKECDFFLTDKKIFLPKRSTKRFSGIEVSVMVLHHNKKYFLIQKNFSSIGKIKEEKEFSWGFPIFFNTEKQDQRHFLKAQALKKWDINISVRPPFYEKIIFSQNLPGLQDLAGLQKIRLKFSRCQILDGKILDSGIEKFYSLQEIAEEQYLEKILEGEVLEKILKMRM